LKAFSEIRTAIQSALPDLHEAEFRLYLYLFERSFANPLHTPGTAITYTQREAMRGARIKSTRTIVRCMASLTKKKLVRWVRRSTKTGDKSLVVVYLPDTLTPPAAE